MKLSTLGRAALAASLFLTVAGAGAAPASAITTSAAPVVANQSLQFNTQFEPTIYGAGAFDGTLHLHFGEDGIVSGWYRDEDGGIGPIDVQGGLTGNKLWLDIGQRWHLTGTFDGHVMALTTFYRDQVWDFNGKTDA